MGLELPARTFHVTRADLVAYADASGDHNPIHQDEAVALAVGLPGVIAHGMYTLALVARYVDEWPDRSAAVVSVDAKFTGPVVVPAEGTEVEVNGTLDGDRVKVTVTSAGQGVLRGQVGLASA